MVVGGCAVGRFYRPDHRVVIIRLIQAILHLVTEYKHRACLLGKWDQMAARSASWDARSCGADTTSFHLVIGKHTEPLQTFWGSQSKTKMPDEIDMKG